MKITLPQLTQQLTQSLANIYLVSGDETLLIEETIQTIRSVAQKQGFNQRERIAMDSSDWTKSLYTATHHLSLFSDKRLIELDLTHIKLTTAHSKILQEFANQPTPDTLLIIRMQKLDYKIEQSAWYKALEKHIVVPIWPMTLQQLPSWIIQRAKKIDLQITQRTAEWLAHYCEGNLLAVAQEIEKLKLLNLSPMKNPSDPSVKERIIDENLLMELSTDHAHFDIFSLTESTLSGNSERSLRILNHLKAEDIEPTLILWALTHELRLLNTLKQQMQKGLSLPALFKQHRIWEKRQAPIQRFLRHSTEKTCWKLLMMAAETDRIIKGAESGNTWDALQRLAIAVAQ